MRIDHAHQRQKTVVRDADDSDSAVGLGHSLGLRVVAEGLQDRLAEAILVEAGCDAAQGFLIGRPVSGAEMTSFLTSTAARANGAGGLDGTLSAGTSRIEARMEEASD